MTQRPSKSNKDEIDICGDGGVMKTILKEGEGDLAPLGCTAKVHYRGTLTDGTVFDTSRTRGQPFKFNVGRREVILGWDKGVATMKKGEICTLKCSPDYAYGSSNVGPIPANSTLIFEVELLDILPAGQTDSSDMSTMLIYVVLLVVCYLLFLCLEHYRHSFDSK